MSRKELPNDRVQNHCPVEQVSTILDQVKGTRFGYESSERIDGSQVKQSVCGS